MAKMHSAPGPREIIAAAVAGELPDEAPGAAAGAGAA